jgi:DNA adenine methylase
MSTTNKRAPRRDLRGAKGAAPLTLGFELPAPAIEPFLKWAGGKGQLLNELTKHLPTGWKGDFYEPFMGSAAFYFHLKSHGKIKGQAHLGDLNDSLVACFNGVKDDPNGVIALLEKHREAHRARGLAYYLEVRAKHSLTGIEAAARFIFLNRTCFNGLWRVNSKGHFNVPMGRYTDPLLNVLDRIEPASQCLAGTRIHHARFDVLARKAKPGSFIYFDPPYDPLNKTSAFTAYTKQGFGDQEQLELRDLAVALHKRGCHVMLSNSCTDDTLEWYKGKSFHVFKVPVRRAISASAASRKMVHEIIVTTYPPRD